MPPLEQLLQPASIAQQQALQHSMHQAASAACAAAATPPAATGAAGAQPQLGKLAAALKEIALRVT